ncbi:membrane protein [Rodentibacter pneumotropicus]|uniref:Membrane protein n=1 Tax=Rodentibacter pneumotropicus TaxID=758 RepID=A0A448MIE0_9PAST|nr:membrane protein [Rodentibacter pneumotropicus]
MPEKLTALSIPLWEKALNFGEIIPDFEITLSMTTHQPMEGYWVLELWHKSQNELVYLLTFAKLKDALLIAVVQGPNFEGAKERVKQLTKACYGLRPAYLMIEVMKALTKCLGLRVYSVFRRGIKINLALFSRKAIPWIMMLFFRIRRTTKRLLGFAFGRE